MSDPSDFNPDPVRGPRAEIVVRMHAGHALPGLHKRLATIAAAPAVEGLILAADALIDLGEPVGRIVVHRTSSWSPTTSAR